MQYRTIKIMCGLQYSTFFKKLICYFCTRNIQNRTYQHSFPFCWRPKITIRHLCDILFKPPIKMEFGIVFFSVFEQNEMKKPSREWVKKLIKKACDDLGVTRESLNIFAGARAVMYFQGNWSSVKFDDVKSLARNGTDILFIDKMGVVEIFTEHADKYGIAIVNTQGLLTEYGKDLMKEAQRQGGHVAILSDYDDHGLLMASKVPDIPRIGIDERTFHYFGLSREVLSIEGQQRLVNYKFLDIFDDKTIDKEFVKKRRVEIDAVLEQVGDRLWEFIMEELTEAHRRRPRRPLVLTRG